MNRSHHHSFCKYTVMQLPAREILSYTVLYKFGNLPRFKVVGLLFTDIQLFELTMNSQHAQHFTIKLCLISSINGCHSSASLILLVPQIVVILQGATISGKAELTWAGCRFITNG
jgi:hypothetical protein